MVSLTLIQYMCLLFWRILKLQIYLRIWECCCIMGQLQQQSLLQTLHSLWLLLLKGVQGLVPKPLPWGQKLTLLNPDTSRRQLSPGIQESRTEREKKCHSQLEAAAELRWLQYHLQGDIHTGDLIWAVLPLLLIHTSQGLHRNLPAIFHYLGTERLG